MKARKRKAAHQAAYAGGPFAPFRLTSYYVNWHNFRLKRGTAEPFEPFLARIDSFRFITSEPVPPRPYLGIVTAARFTNKPSLLLDRVIFTVHGLVL